MTRRLWFFGVTFALAWAMAVPAPAQTTDAALRVNAGGADYVDTRDALWQADHGYNTGEIGRVDTAIAGTEEDTLYQSQRWDDKDAPELAYAFALPDGDYVVHLHFVEFWDGAFAVGKRLFDVWLEGQRVLKRFDVYAEAGANNALVKSFPVTVSDGQLDLLFTHIKQNPMISAIEIVPQMLPVSEEPAVLRVNSGGGDYVDAAGHYWQADTGYDTGEISAIGTAIAGTEDDALYQTARWDPNTEPELAYGFALQNGDYLVKLHFAETWDGAFVVGKRLFDVWIEGQRVLKRFDVYAEAGANHALIKQVPVSVGDGRLDLRFTHIKQNPMISAVEVLPLSASLPPVLAPIGNRLALIGDSVSFTISASHPDGIVPALSAQGLPAGAQFEEHGDGTAGFTWTPVAGDEGSHTLTFTATVGNAHVSEAVTITVAAAAEAHLQGALMPLPGRVDLSAEGREDWVHWGRQKATTVDRKSGIPARISSFTGLGGTAPFRFSSARTAYAWDDGTPAVLESGTTTGIYFMGVGNGYTLILPADPQVRTARFYVGGWQARGEFSATLSDGSAPPYRLSIDRPDGIIDRVVQLDYAAASAGQTLQVRYELMDDYGLSGNITLLAVTLAPGTPTLALPFEESFDADTGQWSAPVDSSTVSSAWRLDGALHQDNYVESRAAGQPFEESFHLGSYRYLPALTATDYRYSVDITPLPNGSDGVDGNDVGVLFRYQDTNNYYRVSFNARYGFTRLEKRVNGRFVPLAVDARGYREGQTFRVTVVVQGDLFQIYVDEDADGVQSEPRFALRDGSHSWGSVGVYAQDRAAFDNLRLSSVDTLPSVVLASPLAHTVQRSGPWLASAVVLPVDAASSVDFYLDGALCNHTPLSSQDGTYTAACGTVNGGDHTLEAVLSQGGGMVVDANHNVGAGEYILAIGDSITNGIGDHFTSDNGVSLNGRILASQGYEGVLSDLLVASGYPSHIVFNEGIGGDTAADALGRIDSIIARHPQASRALLMFGTNDSGGSLPTPSGLGCTGAACNGTYKGQMQQLVDRLRAADMTVSVAQVPPTFGTGSQIYNDPLAAARNQLIREYNQVIRDELLGIEAGPDFFARFYDHRATPGSADDDSRSSLFDDLLHPNGLGYRVMAEAWFDALTGAHTEHFLLRDLCNRLTTPGCNQPLKSRHRQNLLEEGDRYYIDRDYVLSAIPASLHGGIWLMTADAEAGSTAESYIEFELDRAATVYVAYDTDAGTLPPWLDPVHSDFSATGQSLGTSHPAAPAMTLYARDFAPGRVQLGGNLAGGAAGADANYVVVVVPQ